MLEIETFFILKVSTEKKYTTQHCKINCKGYCSSKKIKIQNLNIFKMKTTCLISIRYSLKIVKLTNPY